jgi:hypothetical protein
MKKKTVKKLELTKETLKSLESDTLQKVPGGICRTSPYLSCRTVDCSIDIC